MHLCLWISDQNGSWSKRVISFFASKGNTWILHPLINGSSSYIVSVPIEIQSPNPSDWWKPEFWKKSQFMLCSLSVFPWPCGWWLYASCNSPQVGKESYFMAPINPTVILLRSIFLISSCFFWFPEASWKSLWCNQCFLHFLWCIPKTEGWTINSQILK